MLRPNRWSSPARGAAAAALLGLAGLGFTGCSGGGSGGTPDLFLVSFLQDQRSNLFRDQVLVFEFTTSVDVSTVDLDTFQIFRGTTQNPIPFVGLFEVNGNFVSFKPVVDENTPNRGSVPLNPYGFDENTTYQVKIPSIQDQPTPLKVLQSAGGRPIIQSFSGQFATGSAYSPTTEPSPTFEPWDPAVYDTRNGVKGTQNANDDVLSYTPVPNIANPPLDPQNQPDFRYQHPTNVQAQLTFTSVMDPRTFRATLTGNIRLEFNSPGTSVWNYVPVTISRTPNGRTFLLTAATPLANQARANRYRIVIDQTNFPLLSRGGKKLREVTDVWDNAQQRVVTRTVDEPLLTFNCGMVPGENGPLLTSTFPLEAFSQNNVASDTDVTFNNGMLEGGPVVLRTSEDTSACTLPGTNCNQALREPLTQSNASSNPNPNTTGPSKVQFNFQTWQHANGAPSYKLTNAEALTDMCWGPLCTTVIKADYPKLNIRVMWTERDGTQFQPAGLPSTTFAQNFDRNPPGFPARDGTQAYSIPQSDNTRVWYEWKFQQPFTDYRVDKGLVFLAWTEVGGFTEQYPRWYSPNMQPNTRVFSAPGPVNPPTGVAGQWTFYWTQFKFARLRSLAVTKYYRMTGDNNDLPFYNTVVVSPSQANLPGGTSYKIEYSGGKFTSQPTTRMANGLTYYEAVGNGATTSFSSNITAANLSPYIALRVVFEANINQPNALPFLDGISFTFSL